MSSNIVLLHSSWLPRLILVVITLEGLCVGQTPIKRIAYQAKIEDAPSRGLTTKLERQSQTFLNRETPPASIRQLHHRAQQDIARLERVLVSEGYYEGTVSTSIQNTTTLPSVMFTVDAGPQYQIGRWIISYTNQEDVNIPIPPISIGPITGQPARASSILSHEQALVASLKDLGYPLADVNDRDVSIDKDNQAIHLTTTLNTGPLALFGPLIIKGCTSVEESYIQKRLRWSTQERYNAKALREFEKDLLESRLFAAVRIEPATSLDPNGALPIHINVAERKHRTLRLGGTYVSDEQGLGGRFSWEHRNLRGQGQRVLTQFIVNQTEWRQTNSFIQPDFKYRNLDLLLDLEIGKKYPTAYWSENVRASVLLQYRFKRQSRTWGGIAQETSQVEQFGIRNRYRFLEFPLGVDLDKRDDPLDAKQGWRFLVQTTPTIDARSDLSFFKNYTEGRVYQRLPLRLEPVFAARLGLGLINGASLLEIPADKRFYAGGAGSVRGYAYQSIGREVNGQAAGGLGLLETSFELRIPLWEQFSSVAFLDGGMVMVDPFDRKSGETIQWGAGIGLRYGLGFAPLRFDIAFPLNGDQHDREYQFYVSLGQAF